MFVTSAMIATSACAMNPVMIARPIDQRQRMTTRLSMSARSIGTRAFSMDGGKIRRDRNAFGGRGALRCRTRLLLLFPGWWASPLRTASAACLRRRCRRAARERVGETLLLRCRQPFDGLSDPLLCDRRRFLQRGPAGARERELEAPRVFAGAIALTSPASTRRVTTTETELCRYASARRARRAKCAGVFPSSLRTKSCAADRPSSLRRAVGDTQMPNETPDGVEDTLTISHEWDHGDGAAREMVRPDRAPRSPMRVITWGPMFLAREGAGGESGTGT